MRKRHIILYEKSCHGYRIRSLQLDLYDNNLSISEQLFPIDHIGELTIEANPVSILNPLRIIGHRQPIDSIHAFKPTHPRKHVRIRHREKHCQTRQTDRSPRQL